MRMYELATVVIVTVVGLCLGVGLVSKYWLGPDNVIEETAEKIIDAETGIDIDLTPESKEPVV